MSSVYVGDETNNPTSITIPDDGDDLDVASVNAAFEGLMDKAAYVLEGAATFTGSKTFNGGGEDVAALVTSEGPVDRKLLWEIVIGNSRFARMYARKLDAAAYETAGFDFTTNAAWSEADTEWVADVNTYPAVIYEFMGGNPVPTYDGQDTLLQIKRRGTTTTPWAEDAWDAGGLSLSSGNPDVTDDLIKGTLTTKQIAHAWGVVTCSGGTITLVEGVGVDSAGDGGTGNVLVTLNKAMQSANYAVALTSTAAFPQVSLSGQTTGGFTIRAFTPGGVEANHANDALRYMFVVHGEQA